MTLPSGWLSSTTISAQFVGASSGAAINAGAFSNDNMTWGSWITAASDVTATTWTVSGEGANKPVYLRLRDVNDQVATVISGTVNVDTTPPVGSISVATSTVTSTVTLNLDASDDVSGVGAMRLSDNQSFSGATWQAYSTTVVWPVTGEAVYVQYRDNAGNVSLAYSASLPGEHHVYLPMVKR